MLDSKQALSPAQNSIRRGADIPLSEMSEIDEKLAQELYGKTILVGMTFCNPDGSVIEQKQHFGRIEEITEKGATIKHPESGEEVWLPPDFSGYKKADPGEYRLRSTGEVIVNPDLIGTWTVTKPAK